MGRVSRGRGWLARRDDLGGDNFLVGVEQRINQLAKLAVVAAQFVEISGTLMRRHLQSGINNRLFRIRRRTHGRQFSIGSYFGASLVPLNVCHSSHSLICPRDFIRICGLPWNSETTPCTTTTLFTYCRSRSGLNSAGLSAILKARVNEPA